MRYRRGRNGLHSFSLFFLVVPQPSVSLLLREPKEGWEGKRVVGIKKGISEKDREFWVGCRNSLMFGGGTRHYKTSSQSFAAGRQAGGALHRAPSGILEQHGSTSSEVHTRLRTRLFGASGLAHCPSEAPPSPLVSEFLLFLLSTNV